jgi:hypothetical protein
VRCARDNVLPPACLAGTGVPAVADFGASAMGVFLVVICEIT